MEHIDLNQDQFLKQRSLAERKELGQYFTGLQIAKFMARLSRIKLSTKAITILDAGAGAGILGICAAYHAVKMGHDQILLVCYEIDSAILPLLKQHLEETKKNLEAINIKFNYEIRVIDFVLVPPIESFDLCCINPPYFKYSSNSSYVKSTNDLFKGDPNIYALFVARALDRLKPNGEVIFITPRSFTNGLYFKNFRKYLIQNSSIDNIHIFKSRRDAFKNTEALQENVIFKLTKLGTQKNITITSSYGVDDLGLPEINIYPSDLIIDQNTSELFIRIPENKKDADILKLVERWPNTFKDLDYFISTGPVVEYRAGEFIKDIDNIESIPLINAHHIKNLEVKWTGTHPKDRKFNLINGFSKWVVKNNYYVVMRRISSKDQKKRITTAVYIPSNTKQNYVAFENHVNFIGCKSRKINKEEAYGLVLILRSDIYDTYFRNISGNTQVNATEIKTLKLPSLDLIKKIGRLWLDKKIEEDNIDEILREYPI
ncbi:Eco57I restriction-modification methylase domain-containing protein [Acinetobacter baumannii]|nr:Eco57I restriction-modification methylase domain-containing protein [Acinetobacter baumannii]